MQRFSIILFLTLILVPIKLSAQKFKAYLAFGSNLTEAYLTQSGNSQVGSRLGLNIGPGVSIPFNTRWDANLELLYSKNGYYSNLIQRPVDPVDKISLHYIEVPLTLAYRFNIKQQKEEKFYKRNINFGITYARLFGYKFTAINGTDLTNDASFEQENSLLFNIGATSFFSNVFALNGRGTLSTFGEWTIALRLLYYL